MAQQEYLEDDSLPPKPEEIEDYARFLGMDLGQDNDLLWVAEKGLTDPMPENWKGCVTDDGGLYYFNFSTGESQWNHPNDEKCKKLYAEEKAKKQRKQLPPVKGRGLGPTFGDSSTSLGGGVEKRLVRKEALGPLATKQTLGPLRGQPPSPKDGAAAAAGGGVPRWGGAASGPETVPAPVPERDLGPVDEEFSYTLSDNDDSELNAGQMAQQGQDSAGEFVRITPPPRPSAPTFGMATGEPEEDTEYEEEREAAAEQGRMELQEILEEEKREEESPVQQIPAPEAEEEPEWRAEAIEDDQAARVAFLKDLEVRRQQWQEDEERRQRNSVQKSLEEALEQIRASHQRSINREQEEHQVRLDRIRQDHALELESERISQQRKMAEMQATWRAELEAEKAAMTRMKQEVLTASDKSKSESVDQLVVSERAQREEALREVRESCEKEQREVTEAFAVQYRELQTRLNAELTALRESSDKEQTRLEQSLAVERQIFADRKRAEMLIQVQKEVGQEVEVMRRDLLEREKQRAWEEHQARVEEARSRAEEAEASEATVPHSPGEVAKAAAAPPLLVVPPRSAEQEVAIEDANAEERVSFVPQPPAPQEGSGPLKSSLRGEEHRIGEQEAALSERKKELLQRRHEIEDAREESRRDLTELTKDMGPASESKRAVLERVRANLEQEADIYNKEVQQINASRKYLELRRQRVQAMQRSLSNDDRGRLATGGAKMMEVSENALPNEQRYDRLSDDVTRIESDLAKVLQVLREELHNVKGELEAGRGVRGGARPRNHRVQDHAVPSSAGADALELKYKTLYPTLVKFTPSGEVRPGQAAEGRFQQRMREFRERLLSWESERESAVQQLQRHQQWLKRFAKQIKVGGLLHARGAGSRVVVGDSGDGGAMLGGGGGVTITIRTNS